MKDIRSTVMQLSGRWGNTCYATLCLAVEAALDLPYGDVQMKHLWSAIHERTGKSPQAISRALARAAADVWERGNQELLEAIFARTLKKAPTAKELVFTLAEYVRPQLDFRCFAEPKSGEFGIVVRENYEPVLMTAPFSENRAFVEQLAARLTVRQPSLKTFRRQFLTGEIPGVLPERSGPIAEEQEAVKAFFDRFCRAQSGAAGVLQIRRLLSIQRKCRNGAVFQASARHAPHRHQFLHLPDFKLCGRCVPRRGSGAEKLFEARNIYRDVSAAHCRTDCALRRHCAAAGQPPDDARRCIVRRVPVCDRIVEKGPAGKCSV